MWAVQRHSLWNTSQLRKEQAAPQTAARLATKQPASVLAPHLPLLRVLLLDHPLQILQEVQCMPLMPPSLPSTSDREHHNTIHAG
jgi:hypothetical protein